MINSFSVASSHTASNTGAGAAAITLHFNYNSSSSSNNNHNNNNIKGNINYNNNSGLKILTAPMATSTNEHKSHNTNTTTTTTTAKMFKITQSEVEAKHFLMTYPQQHQQQQQQQQNKSGGASKWLSPGKVNTSAITKEPQFIQVNNSQSITNISNNSNNNSSQKSMQTTTTTTAKPKSAFIGVMSMPQERQQQQKQRTEDQENAFRQIEDVHNYAKLQHHHQQHHLHPHQQQSSSSDELCEEEEDDEEDEDEDEEEDRQEQKLKVNVPNNINNNNNHEDSEEHVEVDVVTVTPTTITPQQQQLQQQEQQQQQLQLQQLTAPVADQDMRPEHHARRPMNAFLIFCKRHRAIVKDRYKSLENRAITKILGDWWAALDEQEKQCFTDLAQQNKDAFFNANPNFKWYKLPAPPLRTLATRPSNANSMMAHSNDEHQQQQQQHIHWEPNEMAHMLRRNYFKFADETQMGDLSALLSASAAANVRDDKDYALQQALSETTQFLSAHMPGNNNNNNNVNNNNNNKIKRSLQPTTATATAAAADSASNSSEEEERGSPSKKLKSTRSCKGKIYQELINSGQLAAIAKKSKCRLNSGSSSSCTTDANSSTPPISPNTMATAGGQLLVEIDGAGGVTSNPGSSSIGIDEFDLEEKIKELPALSLDAYLQRKRSTKKKKKFSSSKKQRNSNSNSGNSNATATAAAKKAAAAMAKKCESETLPAVGSQKRKARKESITRRDVSAIEQEVASILPLTINGCYYINQTPQAQRAPQTAGTASSPLSSASSTLSAQEQQQPVVYDATSTSDLLILAEVAANRTELSKSN